MIVKVRLSEHGYPIVIGRGILSKWGGVLRQSSSLGPDAVIVTNPKVHKLHGASVVSGLQRNGFSVTVFEVPDSEHSKSAVTAFQLLNKIAAYDVGKRIFIAAVGGGVIGDLAGFVASVYKRGVPCVQIPTTFLAQIDSAIGGKTAVDLPVGKNLVGSFYQPQMVISDTKVLLTLSERQIKNGLAEAVKYGVIMDKNLFEYIEKNFSRLLARDIPALEYVVLACSRIKARVVESDEKETEGIRMILNFGHTVGHAVETAGGYRLYHHGEAVALGMRVAARLGRDLHLFPPEAALRLERLLTDIGLPRKIKGLKLSSIMAAMAHDKKFRAGKNRFVIPLTIGKVRIVEGIDRKHIEDAIVAYQN